MDARGEYTGLIGVGFLFGFISLSLMAVCLKQSGHPELAAGLGLGGSVILAGFSGRFVWRKWRSAPTAADFNDDGDVQFCLAVFLLTSIAPLVIGLTRLSPLAPVLLCASAIPARTFVRSLRRH